MNDESSLPAPQAAPQAAPRAAARDRRGGVVLTDGVFDLLHANHVALLEAARSLGDRLIVAVISDRQAASYKRRPVLSETERLRVVQALACVDEAFILDDDLAPGTMEGLIARHGVSAVVYAGECTPEFYLPAERAGIMHRLAYRPGITSSGVIARIVERSRDGAL